MWKTREKYILRQVFTKMQIVSESAREHKRSKLLSRANNQMVDTQDNVYRLKKYR